jgi:uncharacterized protein (UPF0333 family)
MLPAVVLLVLAAAGTYLSITERNKVALVVKKPSAASSKKVAKAPAKNATRSKTTSSKSKTTTAKRPKAKNK